MACSISGLNALSDSVNGKEDVWINENRFRVLKQIGEGGFSYVFLVKEILSDPSSADLSKKLKDPSFASVKGKGRILFSKLVVPVPKRPELGKASPMLEGFTVLLISSPDLFCARIDAISDVHSSRLPTLFSLGEGMPIQ